MYLGSRKPSGNAGVKQECNGTLDERAKIVMASEAANGLRGHLELTLVPISNGSCILLLLGLIVSIFTKVSELQ